MQTISEDKINEIRNSADIVSIISDYIPLKMQGRNYFGVCPFHDDHNPSMSVSKDRQIFNCFVCNKGGNVFTFVKDYLNISFIEAVADCKVIGCVVSFSKMHMDSEQYNIMFDRIKKEVKKTVFKYDEIENIFERVISQLEG